MGCSVIGNALLLSSLLERVCVSTHEYRAIVFLFLERGLLPCDIRMDCVGGLCFLFFRKNACMCSCAVAAILFAAFCFVFSLHYRGFFVLSAVGCDSCYCVSMISVLFMVARFLSSRLS